MIKPLSLWDFSLALYAQPQVEQLCLKLQESYGANVNLLLWAVWLEQRQLGLTSKKLAAAVALVQGWNVQYTQVLRNLRQQLKRDFANDMTMISPLMENIKQTELSAEKREQQWLEELITDWETNTNTLEAGTNLAFYLAYLQVPPLLIEQVRITFLKALNSCPCS